MKHHYQQDPPPQCFFCKKQIRVNELFYSNDIFEGYYCYDCIEKAEEYAGAILDLFMEEDF